LEVDSSRSYAPGHHACYPAREGWTRICRRRKDSYPEIWNRHWAEARSRQRPAL